MTIIRCRECRTFIARFGSAHVRVVGTVEHSRRAPDDVEVLRCASCGTLHLCAGRKGGGEAMSHRKIGIVLGILALHALLAVILLHVIGWAV